MITHPLNRYDLPFITSSGIVDETVSWAGTFSFWVKENFEGIIPYGTPMAQIIPFKRDSWEAILDNTKAESIKQERIKALRYNYGWYKKFVHKRKDFK